MTDNTQPEALRLANVCSNLTRYSMDAHLIAAELRRQHACIAELESELEAVGAGGVQALSAAPVEQEEAAQRLRKTLDIDPGDVNDPLHPRYIAGFKSGHAAGRRRAAPAASPTPPAEQAAPKAAPGEQNTVPAEWLEQAYREGWAACRDAETIGEEAEDWAFGNSTANSRMIDAQQAAPQQEAQEPATVPYQKLTNEIDQILSDPDTELSIGAKRALLWVRTWVSVPLWTTPQPAPDCHHRPPCDECAAIAAQGGKV